jgi:hypothetical protein
VWKGSGSREHAHKDKHALSVKAYLSIVVLPSDEPLNGRRHFTAWPA